MVAKSCNGGADMSLLYWLGGIITVLLVIYLGYALVRAEDF